MCNSVPVASFSFQFYYILVTYVTWIGPKDKKCLIRGLLQVDHLWAMAIRTWTVPSIITIDVCFYPFYLVFKLYIRCIQFTILIALRCFINFDLQDYFSDFANYQHFFQFFQTDVLPPPDIRNIFKIKAKSILHLHHIILIFFYQKLIRVGGVGDKVPGQCKI